jgi:hypothetical protein
VIQRETAFPLWQRCLSTRHWIEQADFSKRHASGFGELAERKAAPAAVSV